MTSAWPTHGGTGGRPSEIGSNPRPHSRARSRPLTTSHSRRLTRPRGDRNQPDLRVPRSGSHRAGHSRARSFDLRSDARSRVPRLWRLDPWHSGFGLLTDRNPVGRSRRHLSVRSLVTAPGGFVLRRFAPMAFAAQGSSEPRSSERARHPWPDRTTQFRWSPVCVSFAWVTGGHRSFFVPLHIRGVLASRPLARPRDRRILSTRQRGVQGASRALHSRDVLQDGNPGFRESVGGLA